MKSEIEKGNKVECIDDLFVDDRQNPFKASELHLPKIGEIYTIREMVDTGYGLGVRLDEIKIKNTIIKISEDMKSLLLESGDLSKLMIL